MLAMAKWNGYDYQEGATATVALAGEEKALAGDGDLVCFGYLTRYL